MLNCAICLEQLDASSCVTACGHVFHQDCATSLVYREKASCPLCRARLQDDQPLVPLTFLAELFTTPCRDQWREHHAKVQADSANAPYDRQLSAAEIDAAARRYEDELKRLQLQSERDRQELSSELCALETRISMSRTDVPELEQLQLQLHESSARLQTLNDALASEELLKQEADAAGLRLTKETTRILTRLELDSAAWDRELSTHQHSFADLERRIAATSATLRTQRDRIARYRRASFNF
mmetsp:Transcript_12928/g.34846  ORF Transcript_12928/g.34846 Transcript_12928/m.34846 type:complete len:241 (-) Transcript_12928:11-733(-)